MSKRIITISREFGSGGRFIGEQLAKSLAVQQFLQIHHVPISPLTVHSWFIKYESPRRSPQS